VIAFRYFSCCFLVLALVACQTTPEQESPLQGRSFEVVDLAKSDVDMVAEVQLNFSMQNLQLLADKLYKRNPKEWKKSAVASKEEALAQLFTRENSDPLPALQDKRSIEAIQLGFGLDYEGDRILALIEGMRGMLLDAHNGKQTFYLLDELDPQKLYNAARNIEIVVWRLSNARDAQGQLLLISNETDGEVKNLSFERLFGKIIALQDSTAQIVADATNRRIKNVILSLATAIFIPI